MCLASGQDLSQLYIYIYYCGFCKVDHVFQLLFLLLWQSDVTVMHFPVLDSGQRELKSTTYPILYPLPHIYIYIFKCPTYEYFSPLILFPMLDGGKCRPAMSFWMPQSSYFRFVLTFDGRIQNCFLFCCLTHIIYIHTYIHICIYFYVHIKCCLKFLNDMSKM